MNKVRSSRDLEKECKRNIEVMWLLNTLKPDHNTISNFRRDNPKAIKKVFRETVRLAKHFNLIGGTLIAGDSTKFRAQNDFTALYDKGYHTGSEFDIAENLGIDVMVSIPATPKSSQAPDPAYNVENFIYNQDDNTYTCPQGHILTTNGTWHKTSNGSQFQQYKTTRCKGCHVRGKCTSSKKNGKIVQRRKYAQNIEANRERIENDKATYKKRQAIAEHPYGTIKRQWGFSYIITKKFLYRASADVGFMIVAYNLRRIINIVGIKRFKEYLRLVFTLFLLRLGIQKAINQVITHYIKLKPHFKVIFKHALKRLFLYQKICFSGGF
jgi:hypothetical protein